LTAWKVFQVRSAAPERNDDPENWCHQLRFPPSLNMWSVYINASGAEEIETEHYQGRMVRAVTESIAFGYGSTGYQLSVGIV
jgi:hypothetical protein